MSEELDMSTIFMLHEVESGLNPEVNRSLYYRILGGSE